jgi:hypothetical protein
MRKFVLFAVLGVVMVAGQIHADTTRAISLGSPIALVDDTFHINTFASRLQNFPSAVFFGVSGATGNVVAFPGVALRLSDAFAFMYIYDEPEGYFGGTVPTALTINTLVAPGTIMNSPLNLWYALKMGTMQLGVFYRMGYFYVDSETFNTNNNTITAKSIASIILHTISPSLTILSEDKSFGFDFAVNLGIQSLDEVIKNAGATNIVSAPALRVLGITAQLTMQLSTEFRLALRLNASHQNNNYVDYNVNAGSNTTNANFLQHVNTVGLTAGFKYQIIPALALYFDLIGQLGQTYNGGSISDSWTLPPSNNLGAEWVVDAWAFRMGVNSRYIVTTTSTIIDGRISGKAYSSSLTHTPYIGIGYKALPWAINFVIDPQIFTKTILVVSSAASYSPIVRFQLNYVW